MASPKSEAPRKRGLPPVHPGQVLREVTLPALKAAGTPRTRVVELLGIGRSTLYEVLEQRRPVTPELALRLGRLLGTTPELWMNLQTAWDLWQARERIADELAAIPTLEKAA
jgi:addiction module HigA family antidote